jgi:cytochrome b561
MTGREAMPTRNSTVTWGWPSILLHWVGAAMIVILLVHGFWMVHFAPRPERFANYTWHAAIGYDVLALLVLRLLWRWLNPVPALPPDSARWERLGAAVSHFGLYVLMFLSTLSGWAMIGTQRRPITQDLFGLQIPMIYQSEDPKMHALLEDSHRILSYLLGALVVVHIAAALWHHFVKRNDILRRMTVGSKA